MAKKLKYEWVRCEDCYEGFPLRKGGLKICPNCGQAARFTLEHEYEIEPKHHKVLKKGFLPKTR